MTQNPPSLRPDLAPTARFSEPKRDGQPTIGMVSLGCPKALVDSERILTRLRADGYEMSPDYAGADVVLVNTCGFLDSATSNNLGFEEYCLNSFVVGFDLTAGLVNFKNLTPSEMGDISIDLTFRTKTTKALTCVFYASYQSILQLDKERTVTHRVF